MHCFIFICIEYLCKLCKEYLISVTSYFLFFFLTKFGNFWHITCLPNPNCFGPQCTWLVVFWQLLNLFLYSWDGTQTAPVDTGQILTSIVFLYIIRCVSAQDCLLGSWDETAPINAQAQLHIGIMWQMWLLNGLRVAAMQLHVKLLWPAVVSWQCCCA